MGVLIPIYGDFSGRCPDRAGWLGRFHVYSCDMSIDLQGSQSILSTQYLELDTDQSSVLAAAV
jgi:hypothetical protein